MHFFKFGQQNWVAPECVAFLWMLQLMPHFLLRKLNIKGHLKNTIFEHGRVMFFRCLHPDVVEEKSHHHLPFLLLSSILKEAGRPDPWWIEYTCLIIYQNFIPPSLSPSIQCNSIFLLCVVHWSRCSVIIKLSCKLSAFRNTWVDVTHNRPAKIAAHLLAYVKKILPGKKMELVSSLAVVQVGGTLRLIKIYLWNWLSALAVLAWLDVFMYTRHPLWSKAIYEAILRQ